jgi:hypothetical protein
MVAEILGFIRFMARKFPGYDGNTYVPEGFLYEEIRPAVFVGKGKEYMLHTREQLYSSERGKRPFRGMKCWRSEITKFCLL